MVSFQDLHTGIPVVFKFHSQELIGNIPGMQTWETFQSVQLGLYSLTSQSQLVIQFKPFKKNSLITYIYIYLLSIGFLSALTKQHLTVMISHSFTHLIRQYHSDIQTRINLKKLSYQTQCLTPDTHKRDVTVGHSHFSELQMNRCSKINIWMHCSHWF